MNRKEFGRNQLWRNRSTVPGGAEENHEKSHSEYSFVVRYSNQAPRPKRW
jgi:hypothetical protein